MEVSFMYEDFVANKVIQLRKQKKLSAREMSLAIGQNVNYINRIEKKLSLPSLQGLFYICEYCNISPKEFFEDTTAPLPISSKFQEALEILSSLDDEQLELILSVAKEFNKKK